MIEELFIAVDGASRGNPGDAGIGVVIADKDRQVIAEISEYIGKDTNNVAEYSALIRGLEEAQRLGAERIHVQTDSELMARQIAGRYRVKAEHLLEYYQRAMYLLSQFRRAEVVHVLREHNSAADKMAAMAAKSRSSKVRHASPRPKTSARTRVIIENPNKKAENEQQQSEGQLFFDME